MNKLLLIAACTVLSFGACAQQTAEREIPSIVLISFKNDNPNQNKVKWDKKGIYYRAKYYDGDEEVTALYDRGGYLVEMENKIEVTVLPPGAKTYIYYNVPGKTITEVYKVTDTEGIVLYDAVVDGTEYVFNTDGRYVDKTTKKDRK